MSKSPQSSNANTKFTPLDRYVYKTSPEVLNSLEVMYFDSLTLAEMDTPSTPLDSPTPVPSTRETTPGVVGDREYYKSDYYKFNLRREVNGLPKLSEEEFDKLIDEQQETESISGSEDSATDDGEDDKNGPEKEQLDTIYEKSLKQIQSLSITGGSGDDEEEQTVSHLATKSPYILYKSELLPETKAFALYKALLSPQQLAQPSEAIKQLQTTNSLNSAIFMIGGGHFAAALISHTPLSVKNHIAKPGHSVLEYSVNVIKQKSIHRYTTRRKQGGSQSASDNAHGKANSAGSALRRHNEAMLVSEVKELITEWKEDLGKCVNIFVKANGASNKRILVNSSPEAVIRSDDFRVKTLPFTTKRATMTELKKAWVELSYLTVVDRPRVDERKLKERQARQEALRQSVAKKERESTPELSQDEKHTREIISYLKKGRGPLLMAYLKKHKLSAAEFKLQPKNDYFISPTILHYASAQGLKNLIPTLIKQLKCDITAQNSNGKTAYELGSKQIRQVFQTLRFDLGEEAYPWEEGKVGPAIDKEALVNESNEEKAKLELEKKAAISELLAQPTEEEIKIKEANAKARRLGTNSLAPSLNQVNLNSLTDDQRMRLMREQRARAAEARIKAMQSNNGK
ncbi:hypothetical protein WICPIJ_001583 [Wickerhamomyces pijperi]|uniref:VLRF1 domain-containing protein n=2 Tax=Wickerhamomyces TaxID=599737 RepID=A0A9P8QD91_WICPI|nr:hypothetical protein WICPIJ_001583 [Wickerhamomyces pijperi]